jgi:phosphatidylcholine synthase
MSVGHVEPRSTAGQRIRAYAVHVYTACGVGFAFLAAAEMCRPEPDVRLVFLLFAAATMVDATDGPFARMWQVKRFAPNIDGRKIDDIVDYLTFTFLPLLLVWRMGWVPEPGAAWIIPALIASLFGFANEDAKDEEGGFFLGFPSYWNVVALYAGIAHHFHGPMLNGVLLLILTVLTIAPVKFIYPNLAPRPWRIPVLAGAFVWLGVLIVMAYQFPHVPGWLVLVSLSYPVFYTVLSAYLARRRRGP